MLIALGTTAIVLGSYLARTPSSDRYELFVWLFGSTALALALWLAWRDRTMEKRREWMMVIAGALLFCSFLIIDALLASTSRW